MRPDQPRLDPLPSSEWTDEVRGLIAGSDVGGGEPLNIFTTLAHHPKLMKRWVVFANHVLFKSELALRLRELAILRVGWLCQAPYEFGQHTLIARRSGITDEEISALTKPIADHDWNDEDRLVLEATDELYAHHGVSDETWARLTDRFSTQEILDLVFAVGQYQLVSTVLNTVGVALDEGVPGFPADAGPPPPGRG
jgi:alkylhydroperoxidase family enzyme